MREHALELEQQQVHSSDQVMVKPFLTALPHPPLRAPAPAPVAVPLPPPSCAPSPPPASPPACAISALTAFVRTQQRQQQQLLGPPRKFTTQSPGRLFWPGPGAQSASLLSLLLGHAGGGPFRRCKVHTHARASTATHLERHLELVVLVLQQRHARRHLLRGQKRQSGAGLARWQLPFLSSNWPGRQGGTAAPRAPSPSCPCWPAACRCCAPACAGPPASC